MQRVLTGEIKQIRHPPLDCYELLMCVQSVKCRWMLDEVQGYLDYSQPVGTTGVESRNVYWVFGFRRVNRALRLDPHSFNARSKRDLPRF
jgi:hypothetical protein